MKFIIKAEILNAEGPIFGLAENQETETLYFYGNTGNGKIYVEASHDLLKQYLLDKITLAELFTKQSDKPFWIKKPNLLIKMIDQSVIGEKELDFCGCGECFYSKCPDYVKAINDIPEFLEKMIPTILQLHKHQMDVFGRPFFLTTEKA